MKKLSIKVLAEISIFASIGFVLDVLAGLIPNPAFAEGGSIGIAMVAIFVVGYRRGVIPALFTGLLIGLLSMSTGVYAIADTWYKVFFQVGLDYWICYTVVGVGVLFFSLAKKAKGKKKITYLTTGIFVGSFLKFISHFLSGVIFFGSYTPEGTNVIWYSIYYNAGYMIPCFVLSLIVMIIFSVKYEAEILVPNDHAKLHANVQN